LTIRQYRDIRNGSILLFTIGSIEEKVEEEERQGQAKQGRMLKSPAYNAK